VYSLGVVLFELLTGERPFRGNARMLLHQVIHEEPPSPRSLNGNVPRDLETICLKCLQKERTARYATAGEVAAELRRFLQGEPILARPVGRVVRAGRWARRNPALAALLSRDVAARRGGRIRPGLVAGIADAEARVGAAGAGHQGAQQRPASGRPSTSW
jgi:hypothetical protein